MRLLTKLNLAGALALLLLGAAGLRPAPDSAAAADFSFGDQVVVATDALNYRTGPGLDAAVIAVFFTGKQGAITDGPVAADGFTWYEFSTAGYGPDGATPGWLAGEFLAHADGGGGGFPAGSQVVVSTDLLNLRDAPGLAGAVLAVLPTGVSGTVLEPPLSRDGFLWHRVNFGPQYGAGWVAGEFLAAIAGGGFNIGDPVTVRSVGGLNYRTGPSLAAGVIRVWPNGKQGTITDGPVYADGYIWWQFSTEGYGPDGATPGWLAGQFLE